MDVGRIPRGIEWDSDDATVVLIWKTIGSAVEAIVRRMGCRLKLSGFEQKVEGRLHERRCWDIDVEVKYDRRLVKRRC